MFFIRWQPQGSFHTLKEKSSRLQGEKTVVIRTVYLLWTWHIQRMSGNNLLESIFVNLTGK